MCRSKFIGLIFRVNLSWKTRMKKQSILNYLSVYEFARKYVTASQLSICLIFHFLLQKSIHWCNIQKVDSTSTLKHLGDVKWGKEQLFKENSSASTIYTSTFSQETTWPFKNLLKPTMLKKLEKDIIIFPALWILVASLTQSTNALLLKYNAICY